MRLLQVKYAGACSRCGKDLEVGKSAMYEKTTGIFCVGCEPVEVEDIRAFRLAKAEKRAGRLNAKADRLDRIADERQAAFNRGRQDWAWLTQPGYIPGRDKALKGFEKGMELQIEAQAARDKAENVIRYKTQVKGDAERARQAKRDYLDSIITTGSRIDSVVFGPGTVTRIYKKSYGVKFDRLDRVISYDKSFCRPLKDESAARARG